MHKRDDYIRVDPRIVHLLDVMQAMTSTLETDELLQRIVEAVTRILPCESCILWMYNDEKKLLQPQTIQGFKWEDVETHCFAPSEGTIGKAFSEQKEIITNDLKKFSGFVRKGDIVEGIQSLLDVPLVLKGQSIGVLDAVNKIPEHVFDDEDAKILSILAAQAAIAIGNAKIHSSVQRQVYELNILHSFTQTIGTNLNTSEVLEVLLTQAATLMDMEDCSIFLFDPKEQVLELAEARNQRKQLIGRLKIPLSQGLVGYAAATRHTVMVSDEDLDEFRAGPPPDYGPYQIAIASAMYLPDKLIGVIEVRDTKTRDISDETVMLFKTITKEMAVFLEKARLYSTVQELYLDVIKSLSEAVEAKDPATIGHCFRVSYYAAQIARAMGLDEELTEQIRVAGHLHDIGKIGVPERILLKTKPLTESEYDLIKRHSDIGAKILEPIEMLGKVSTLVRYHHEHFDGTGYPEGLKGEEIPLGSRILAVADSFEAMTWNRPYREGQSHDSALVEIKKCAGAQFDPQVVEAFARVYRTLFLSHRFMER